MRGARHLIPEGGAAVEGQGVAGAGERSITVALNMVRWIEQVEKPARIFSLSDFDPAGQSMPVAMARKLEEVVRTRQVERDIRLFPLVLTVGQAQRI